MSSAENPTPSPPTAASRNRSKPRSAPPPRESGRTSRSNIGVIIFVATLMGSLLGVAADLGQAADTVEQFRSLFYPELCVVGSNTILGEGITMAVQWAEAFEQRTDVRVTIDGIGSVRGVEKAVNGGCVHVLAMSEPMTNPQYIALTSSGLSIGCAAEIGYDVIAFVTDINNPLPALLSRNLISILTGRLQSWADVGGQDRTIRILARPGSGTTEFVLINVARYSDPNLMDDQYFPPDTNYVSCNSNENCLDETLSTPGSLYWVSSAWLRTQPAEYINVMPILRGDERPINPLQQEVDLNEYPSTLVRPLYFYVLNGPTIDDRAEALATEFLTYVRSIQGQQILEEYYFYNYFTRPFEVAVSLPPGFEPDADGVRPVCLPA
ncbi:MAG: substrate-binding domain-containing protein [bacterium]|nr:substrate-binding domain-containing protein [bacterium]